MEILRRNTPDLPPEVSRKFIPPAGGMQAVVIRKINKEYFPAKPAPSGWAGYDFSQQQCAVRRQLAVGQSCKVDHQVHTPGAIPRCTGLNLQFGHRSDLVVTARLGQLQNNQRVQGNDAVVVVFRVMDVQDTGPAG